MHLLFSPCVVEFQLVMFQILICLLSQINALSAIFAFGAFVFRLVFGITFFAVVHLVEGLHLLLDLLEFAASGVCDTLGSLTVVQRIAIRCGAAQAHCDVDALHS